MLKVRTIKIAAVVAFTAFSAAGIASTAFADTHGRRITRAGNK